MQLFWPMVWDPTFQKEHLLIRDQGLRIMVIPLRPLTDSTDEHRDLVFKNSHVC